MYVQQIKNKVPGTELQQLIDTSLAWRHAGERGLTWEAALQDKESVKAAAESLTPYGRFALWKLLQHAGTAAIEEERLLTDGAADGLLSGLELKAGIRELLASGLAFAVRKIWGERLLFIPIEAYGILVRSMLAYRLESYDLAGKEISFQPTGKPAHPLGRQLLGVFAELARCGAGLTAKGSLQKKTVIKLQRRLQLTDEALRPYFQPPQGRDDQLPLTAAFGLHAGLRLGLLSRLPRKSGAAKEGHTLEWNEDNLYGWLNLEAAAREHRLLEWLQAELLARKPEMAMLAAAMQDLPRGSWFKEEELLDIYPIDAGAASVTLPAGQSRTAGYALQDMIEGWLELLQHCGWVERGTAGEDKLFRWILEASAGEEGDEEGRNPYPGPQAFVQPNGEIIVFPHCSFALRWELEICSELVEDDVAAVYKLTESTIRQACRNGRTAKHMIETLKQAAGEQDVPEAALKWVEESVRRTGLLSIQPAVLLQCADRKTADELAAQPALAPYLLERLGEVCFRIDPKQCGALQSQLEKAGYPAAALAGTPEAGTDPVHFGAVDFLKSGKPAPTYSPASQSAFPEHSIYELITPLHTEQKPLVPDEIPAIWLSQLRKYHHSTRRELLEQALKWQAPVQVKLVQEGLCAFIPEKLENHSQGWSVSGYLRVNGISRPATLTPEMWSEMKLLVPD